MLRVSPEPAQYVAVQMSDMSETVEMIAPAAYRLPPVLRLSRVLGFSLFGLGRSRRPVASADTADAADAADTDAADAVDTV